MISDSAKAFGGIVSKIIYTFREKQNMQEDKHLFFGLLFTKILKLSNELEIRKKK